MRIDQENRVVSLRGRNSQPFMNVQEEIRCLMKDPDSFEPFSALDMDAINSEEDFRRRFGLGFSWNEKHRRALIELKRRFDLTDPEIRLMHHTGNLKRTSEGVFMSASYLVAIIGGIQLGVIAAVYGFLLAFVFFNLSNPLMMLNWCVLLFFVIFFCYALNWTYIKPWRVQCRVLADNP